MNLKIRRASRIVQKNFEDYACNKQNFLGDDAKINKFLAILPAEYMFFHYLFFSRFDKLRLD